MFEARDYEAAVAFYRDGLGLPVVYSWDRGADRGSFFGAASGIIEVVSDHMGLRGPNKRASGNDWWKSFVDERHETPGRNAFRTLAFVYQLFGLPPSAIPFAADSEISEEAIRQA